MKFTAFEIRKMKTFFTIFIIVLVVSANAQTTSINKSSPLEEASPESAGMSAERLQRIETMCSQAVSDDNIPGVVALVARHGKIVYWKAFGMADNQSERALKRDDIFRIASQSKASNDVMGGRKIQTG